MEDEYLTVAEAARRLGIHTNTVYGLTARGDLPASGWPLRIRRSEVDAYITRSRVKPGDLSGSNQYAGRPTEGVAQWYRRRWASR